MAANLAAGGTFFSSGTVRGGTGGSGGLGALYGGGGGSGGAGIALAATVNGTNQGTMSGGAGGSGGHGVEIGGNGGTGGAGAAVAGTFTNTGTIQGGSGGGSGSGLYYGAVGGTGGTGVVVTGSGSLVNTGLIAGGNGNNGAYGRYDGGSGGDGGTGVSLSASGSLTNTGTILGGSGGGGGPGKYGPNGGSGASGTGIRMTGGGVVTNGAGAGSQATIGGGVGIDASGGPASVINYGTVSGATGAGIALNGGGTVFDAGTISGGNGTAVSFGGAGGNRLILMPSYALAGTVAVSGTGNVLELASAASTGTLRAPGGLIATFGSIAVDSGATWALAGKATLAAGHTLVNAGTLVNMGTLTLLNTTLTSGGGFVNNGELIIDPSSVTLASLTGFGTTTIEAGSTLDITGTVSSGETIVFADPNVVLQIDPAQFAGQIDGFTPGDTIVFNGLSNVSGAHVVNGNTLEVDLASGGPLALTFDPAGNYAGASFSVTSNSVTPLCFLRDTLILTPRGEVTVQDLKIGDTVTTLAGADRPIRWIGMGRVLIQQGKRCEATPVLIRKSAIADNVPNRDLRVTKGHSLYLDGVLIPAEFLVNHRSVLWDDHAHVVEFYHIELDTHDVLVANGAAAESYRDDGNRHLFQNANPAWGSAVSPSCAPVETGGAAVDAVWARLLRRAGARPGMPLTNDPALHLMVGGQRIDPVCKPGGVLAFRVPERPGPVRLVSRATVPAELGLCRDARRLGVAVRQVVVLSGPRARLLDLETRAPLEGFHAFEAGERIRWTDGDALLPAHLFDLTAGPFDLEVTLGGRTQYPDWGTRMVA